MNIKFNWGTGILITIILFLMAMTGIIVFSMNQQVNLVSPDYYPKGVNYDKQILKAKNLELLKEKVSLKKDSETLKIIFPAELKNKVIKGNIQFYYITDFEKDINHEINLDSNMSQQFLRSQFQTGRYIVKLDWEADSTAYYQEIDINL